MRSLVRMGIRLGWARESAQRWRQLSLILGTALGVLVLGLAGSVVSAAHDVHDHLLARGAIWAESEEAASFFITPRGFVHNRQDVTILWIEPAAGHEDDPTIVPPGLSALPEPGTAVVSQRAAEIGLSPVDLGVAQSEVGTGPDGTIGPEGLGALSEALVWLRPAEGRSLGEGGNLLPFVRFPQNTSEALQAGFSADPPLGTMRDAMFGATLFLVFPGVLLIAFSSRALSPARTARSEMLLRYGITGTRVRALLAVEAASLAVVGALLGVVLHSLLVGTSHALPLTDTVLHPGALRLTGLEMITVAGLAVLLAVVCASVGQLQVSKRQRSPRQPRWWSALPLLAGLAVTAGNHLIAQQLGLRQDSVFGTGVVLLAIGVPLALPWLTRRIANMSVGSDDPARWLAARNVTFSPRSLTRPASMLALLLLLGASSVSLAATVLAPNQSAQEQSGRVIVANWRDVRPDDASILDEELQGIGARAIEVQNNGDDNNYAEWLVVHDCSQLDPVEDLIGNSTCTPEGTTTAAASQWLERATGLQTRTTEPGQELGGAVLIVTPAGITIPDILQAGGGTLPAFNPGVMGNVDFVPTMIRWYIAGWIAATLVLSLVILRELGDRSLDSAAREGRLLRLGLTRSEVSRTSRWTILLPVVVAIPLGYVSGLLIAWAGQGPEITQYLPTLITFYSLGIVALSALTLAAVTPLRRAWAFRAAGEMGRTASPTLGVLQR